MSAATAKPEKGNKTAPAAEKPAKSGGVCLMTGEAVSKGANFKPGMDARLKGLLIKVVQGTASLNTVPKAALKWLRDRGEKGGVGFQLIGDNLTKIGNFNIGSGKKAKAKKAAQKEVQEESARGASKGSAKRGAQERLAKKSKSIAASLPEGDDDE